MYTDLFLALLNRKNAREHPTLSALLYAFCPTAAHWWFVGADPIPPFDPVWRSLEDLTSGGTLLDHLTRYGFDSLTDEIREYVHQVDEYRKQHPIQSPELLPLFSGGMIEMARRFGSQNAIENFSGDWRNLFIYVRTWAFLTQDWRSAMRIDRASQYKLSAEKVHLTLPFARLPVQFDTWVWRIQFGHVTEIKIGLLVSRMEQDQLRFALMRKCQPVGQQPWQNTPALYALDRDTGDAKYFEQTLDDEDLERVVQSLARLAKAGPHFPINALSHPLTCAHCGYKQLCFEKKQLSVHALSTL
jgi:hypothetical protein